MNRAHPVLRSFDRAFEDLRRHGRALLAPYFLGMVPFTLAVAWLAEALVWERGEELPLVALALTLGTVFRWLGVAAMQRRALALQGREPPPWRRRWRAVLVLRTFSALVIWWGLVIPVFTLYGLMLSALVGPAALEADEPDGIVWRSLLRSVNRGFGTMLKTLFVAFGGWLLVLANLFALLWFATDLAVPSLLGVDAPVLSRVAWSRTGAFGWLYLSFVLVDAVWNVASVHVALQLRERRDGGDLSLRISALERAGLPSAFPAQAVADPVSGGEARP